MAKAKSGGTRSYIRGRVGADVYSIGRDAKGKKQQVVRSLAETVANPQTQSQMRGRMIMSTLMQTVAVLKPIIDHSFDNVTGKQPNISEFISRNYALIKADVAANPASGNYFGLVKYGQRGAKQGAYIISDGSAQLPSALALNQTTGVITIALTAETMTVAGLKAALGLSEDEYFTLVGINTNGGADYERFRISPDLADADAISASNIASVFATEGNANATVAVVSNSITITLSAIANSCAIIISKKVAGGYVHNKAVLGAGLSLTFNANAALPTYPVGSADYLNGGDIFGLTESNASNGGGSVNPNPGGDDNNDAYSISSVLVNSTPVTQGTPLQLYLDEGKSNMDVSVVVNFANVGQVSGFTIRKDGNSFGGGYINDGETVASATRNLTQGAWEICVTNNGVNETTGYSFVINPYQGGGDSGGGGSTPSSAELTALTCNDQTLLAQQASVSIEASGTAVVNGTLNQAVTTADGYKLGMSTDMSKQVGDSYATGANTYLGDAANGTTLTISHSESHAANLRVYLIKGSTVAAVCGQLVWQGISMD